MAYSLRHWQAVGRQKIPTGVTTCRGAYSPEITEAE